jgi:hypothetical protein
MFPADTKPGFSRQPATTPPAGTESTCQRARRPPPCHRASGRPAMTLGQFPQVHVPARSHLWQGPGFSHPHVPPSGTNDAALAQTGLPTHLPRAAPPLNSPHGTDDAVPRMLPSATPYGDLARSLVSGPRTGEGAALPDESAGRGIRLRPGRALWVRPLFSHPVNPRNAADTKAPPHRVERATDAGAFR